MKKNSVVAALAAGAAILVFSVVPPVASLAAGTAATTAPAVAATNGITKDQALQIAFDHAGIKKSDALFTSVKKDFDDGMEIYEVEFHVGFNEYNYDIAASNGQIIDFDIDD